MSTRKVHEAPRYSPIQDARSLRRVQLEINRMKPEAEVSVEGALEGSGEMAIGHVISWQETKKLLTVEWKRLPEAFEQQSGSRTGLRSFFKVRLLSTQLIFKCELIRRLPDGSYQYRIPLQLYQLQNRGALRLPLKQGEGKIKTPQGTFRILDLSASGARLQLDSPIAESIHHLENCTLILGSLRLSSPQFGITLTHRSEDQTGCRFHGLTEDLRNEIKKYLIQELQHTFQEN